NILLDENGNLKISDFGLATVFRYNGKVRMLTTPCGTAPYVAPEIHKQHYHGSQVDTWSTGIILYVLLAGNTPWGAPLPNDPEFEAFLTYYDRGLPFAPWNTFGRAVKGIYLILLFLEMLAFELTICDESPSDLENRFPKNRFPKDLVVRILNVDTTMRYTADDIKSHKWFQRPNTMLTDDGKCNNPVALAEMMKSKLCIDDHEMETP
ncbi:glycerol ethanol, ferric requiring protein, partial [Blyttiomyces sp. JEL0837]